MLPSSSSLVAALVAANKCYISNPNLETYVKTPEPWTYMSNDELPKAYDPYEVAFSHLQLVVTLTAFPTCLCPRTSTFLSTVDPAGLSLLPLPFLTVFV